MGGAVLPTNKRRLSAGLHQPSPEIDAAKAKQLVLGWLARREHSQAEVEEKLVRKGAPPELSRAVAAHMATQGLLSDDRFAEVLVRSRRQRGYGPMRIRKELEEKGLARDAIDRWVDLRSHEWMAELERVRRKKFGARPPRDYMERAKQARFLQYRGFTYDQIQRALDPRSMD